MWGKMGHPAKITQFWAKTLLSLRMDDNKWEKAHFPHFYLIPSFFIDFCMKNHDLTSNRHFHIILYKTCLFLSFDNFFQLNWHIKLFFFH